MFIYLFTLIALGHVVLSLQPGDSSSERYPIRNVSNLEVGHPKIVNGVDAKLGEFPWMVQLAHGFDLFGLKSSPWHAFGGSIINHEWILTAAHCTTLWPLNRMFPWNILFKIVKISVFAGSIKSLDSSATVRHVVKVVFHPQYNCNLSYDVALLKLNEPLEFNGLIDAIDLASFESDPGSRFTLTGWGLTETATITGKPATTLQKINVPLGEINACVEGWNAKPNNRENQIEHSLKPGLVCSKRGPKGETAYNTDSGGPVVQYDEQGKPHQIGILNFVDKPAAKLIFSSKVSFYREWIKKTIVEN